MLNLAVYNITPAFEALLNVLPEASALMERLVMASSAAGPFQPGSRPNFIAVSSSDSQKAIIALSWHLSSGLD